MTYILYFTSIIGNYIASFRKKESIFVILLTLITILLLWIGMSEGPDIFMYNTHFANAEARIFKHEFYQFIYNYTMYWFYKQDLTFYQYRFFTTFVSWVIIYYTLKTLKTNIHLVLFAYLFVEFFMEGIQIRNFLAIPFLMLGFLILIKDIPYKKILFLLIIFIAASIHSSFIVYSIFIFIPSLEIIKNKTFWIYGLGALCTITFFFLFRNQLGVIINLLISFDEIRGLHYTQRITNMGVWLPVFIQIFTIIVIKFIYFQMSKIKDISHEDKQTINTILWINILDTYLVSFCILDITFYRLVRNLLLINWTAIGIGSRYLYKKISFKLFAIGYLLLWIIAEFIIWNNWGNIIPYFFNYNLYL